MQDPAIDPVLILGRERTFELQKSQTPETIIWQTSRYACIRQVETEPGSSSFSVLEVSTTPRRRKTAPNLVYRVACRPMPGRLGRQLAALATKAWKHRSSACLSNLELWNLRPQITAHWAHITASLLFAN